MTYRARSLWVGVVIVAVVAFLWQGIPASAAVAQTNIVVKVRAGDGGVTAQDTGGHVVRRVDAQTVVLSVADDSASSTLNVLRSQSNVAWAEPDYRYKASDIPNDPCYVATCHSSDQQYYTDATNAPSAWSVTKGDPNMKIAVLDSGIDPTHPDLAGHVVVGPNYSDDNTTLDLNGHGTHVAGVIGAISNNGIGMAGLVWNSTLISVKVLDSAGSGDTSSVALGLRWAADNGVRIANLSLGGTDYSDVVADAVNYAESKGVLIVAAAGNEGTLGADYPAALPGVLSVCATDHTNQLVTLASTGNVWGSNYGPSVSICAPGVGVVSTWPSYFSGSDGYRVLSGTSMSTPQVTGAAALVWSASPYASSMEVEQRLMDTATNIPGSGTTMRSGLLNIGAAVRDTTTGYRLLASDGGVFSYGGVSFKGSMGGQHLNAPIVTGMTTGDPDGYWMVASDGGIFSFGDASFKGSMGGQHLNAPIVGGAATRSGNGYWMVASDGGVFSFGDAAFYGSTGGTHLFKPIVALVPTATGRGYWLIASDGGVFSFGDAAYYGSTGGTNLFKPIVGAARTADGGGYWLVASDGGIFSFGDAEYHGSIGGSSLAKPVVGMSPTADGNGYWLVASDGGVFSYGDAQFLGSTGGTNLNQPVVAMLN